MEKFATQLELTSGAVFKWERNQVDLKNILGLSEGPISSSREIGILASGEEVFAKKPQFTDGKRGFLSKN